MDARVTAVPASLRRQVAADPEEYLPALVATLVQGIDDPFRRTKILHDWVADNIEYDVESYLSGSTAKTSSTSVVQRYKSVCEGYSNLFQRMCELAEIQAVKIAGYGRGYRFATTGTGDVADSNHAWNAVNIRNRWYFVDTTWDAGYVEAGKFRKHFSHTYLFLAPDEFVYTHLPADPQWQLLDSSLSERQFAELPYLKGRFFEHGLKLKTRLQRRTVVGESVIFKLRVPEDVLITAVLKDEQERSHERATLVRRHGQDGEVLVLFPGRGEWQVHLHCKRRSDPGSFWQAAILEFVSKSGTSRTFPRTYANYLQDDGFLYGPLYLPLDTAQPKLFKVRVRNAEAIYLTGGKQWKPLTRSDEDPDLYELTETIQAGEPVRLTVKTSAESRPHRLLVDFTPESEKGGRSQ